MYCASTLIMLVKGLCISGVAISTFKLYVFLLVPPHHHLRAILSTHLLLFTLMTHLFFYPPFFLHSLPLWQILLMCYVCLLTQSTHIHTLMQC